MSIEFQLQETYDADVIVVGAGPAGAAAAYHLARAGVDVLMVDGSSFPRDKVCGDFVGPVALAELADIGVTVRADFQQTNRIVGASLHLDGKHMVTRNLPAVDGLPPFGRVIPRLDLDEWIRQAAVTAGSRFRGATKVTEVSSRPRAVIVEATEGERRVRLRARLVIGADGSNSKVASGLRGAPIDKRDRIMAVRAYYSGVSGPGDRCDMYFSEDSFPGYYWLFPTSATTANVGLGMVMETTPPSEGHLRTMLLDLVGRDRALHSRLGGATIEGRVLGWPLSTYNRHAHLVADGVMLIGDAAGLINPLNGEGIQYALLSGRWASNVARQALARHEGVVPVDALVPYERLVSRELRPEMALAGTIVSLIRRRDLNGVWLQALRTICARAEIDKEYAEIAGGILAGITPATTALSREIVGGTVKQALRRAVGQGARTALRPRSELRQLGESVIETAGNVVGNSARDPIATTEWAADVARAVVELATQTGWRVGQPAAQSSRSTM
jgi:menaquinone-9 beta-reductase